jgi:two-component system NtrC family sensor kinase
VFRTLRYQLIAIVLATVATVLAVSQWLDTSLSERELERDLRERGRLVLRTIDSLWGQADTVELRRQLRALVKSDRQLIGIDVFELRDRNFGLTMTTRPGSKLAEAQLTPDEQASLLSGVAAVPPPDGGGPSWRMLAPLLRDGVVTGAAQVEFSLAQVARLEYWLRFIDAVFLVSSILAISLLLGLFLERRVTHPVAALVQGMQRAELGQLGARVSISGGGEFAFLARSFNRMLGRLDDLTTGLESRVQEATRALAENNRELQDANEKLWRAQLEVGRSERLATLGQMAATIAHELGTPLNSVLGYTQLLLREDLPFEQATKLRIVESQIQRMIETIRSVLDRTRDRDLRRAPVALAPLVAEALALISARIAGRELSVRNEVPAELPPVPGDGVALRQMLLNLLTNAIDATEPPGSITVSAALLPVNGRPGRHLELVVRDSGHGMSPEELRRAFEPFYTTKAPGRGTGLGLAIVDHIVRAHGGQVLVESAPGAGTTMRVRLPLEP